MTRRKVLWTAVAVVALWILTGVVGVPAVVKQIPALETEALVAAYRKSRHTNEDEIAVLRRALTIRVHSAVAVLPFLVLVTYEGSVGDAAVPNATRVVLWCGRGTYLLGSGQRGDRA
jgi:hypothetical protein